MSARPIAGWEEIITGQIRGIQDRYPSGHELMVNWGAWGRNLAGIYPGMTANSMWDQATEHPRSRARQSWAEEIPDMNAEEIAGRKRSEPLTERRSDPSDEDFEEKAATEIDVLIHAHDFPRVWWDIALAVYAWRRVEPPVYRLPQLSGMSEATFITAYDSLLAWMEGR